MIKVVKTGIALVMVMGCSLAVAQDADVKREISAIIAGVYGSFQEHEPEGIDRYMDPDVTVWDVFTPQLIQGKAESDRFHAADQQQMQARGPLTLVISEPIVSNWDDTAIARYYLDYKYGPPNAAQGRVRITDVFRRINQQWKIVHHHEGAVPTGIPPIAD